MKHLEIEEVQPLQTEDSATKHHSHKKRPGLAKITFAIVLLVCIAIIFLRNQEKYEIDLNLVEGGTNITEVDDHYYQLVMPTLHPTSSPIIPSKMVTTMDGVMYNTIGDMLYHNDRHFTQGLTYSKSSNILFESNGLYRRSSVCRLDPETGHELLCKDIEKEVFAEGMQVYGHGLDEKLIQLTWKSQRGFIYNATTLDRISEFSFSTRKNEGWGICLDEDNNEFIVSDGSNTLHFWDVDTLEEKRRVQVFRQSGKSAVNLNELEFVKGKVLANVWFEDVVLVIDPITGRCEGEYNFSYLWPSHERQKDNADVLNGISISKDEDVLYITGKLWNRMHKVTLNDF